MTIARQIADLVDSGGDINQGALDNVPASDWNTILNKPGHADTDTRIGSNITSGTIPAARLGSGTVNSSTYLRGDGSWVTNCTNHSNCANCSGTGTYSGSACAGTLITASGSASGSYGGTLTYSGSHVTLTPGACACACDCACACNC